MAADSPKDGRKRRGRGFRRAGPLLEPQMRVAGESRGFAVSRVLTHWAEIAGAGIADKTRPVDIRYGRGGLGATLTVLTTGAHAPMIEMQKEALRTRVNACYGYNAISAIRVTQTAPSGFADGAVAFTQKPKAEAAPDPEVRAAARATAAPVADGDLRRALEMLGTHIMSRKTD